jgi:hypothetical protein
MSKQRGDQDDADWLLSIAQEIDPADGSISAMFLRHPEKDVAEWRLLAFVGPTWERAGDGFAIIEQTDRDPVTRRDSDAVREIWKDCITRSRAQSEQLP